jgi:hypothetical protein
VAAGEDDILSHRRRELGRKDGQRAMRNTEPNGSGTEWTTRTLGKTDRK